MIRKYMLGLMALCACICSYAQTEVTDSVAAVIVDLNPTDLFDQANLGRAYLQGTQGMEQDDAKALYWIEKSAAQGLADSQLLAGLCRYNGIGCPADEPEALRWLQLAAAQDYPYAMYVLGSIYANREPADWKNAVEWFEKGAELGDHRCQTELGICYISEHGVELDYGKAAELLTQAIEEDIPDAFMFLGMLYRHGAGVPKDEMKSRLLLEKAASLGSTEAAAILGK